MLVGHLAGHADVVADVGDVRRGEDNVPVEMPVPGPGVEPAHGAVGRMGRFRSTGVVEALEVFFPPGLGKQQLGFVEDQEGPAGRPLEPRAHLFEVFQRLQIEVDDFRRVGQVRKDLIGPLQGEAAHVGDDHPPVFQRGHGVILDRAGGLVGAIGAVMDLDRHGSPPNERHEAHAEARRRRDHDDVQRLRHAEEGQTRRNRPR